MAINEDQAVRAWALEARREGGRIRIRELRRRRTGSIRTKEQLALVLSAYRRTYPALVVTERQAGGGRAVIWICAPAVLIDTPRPVTGALSGKFFYVFRDEDGQHLIERQGQVRDEVQPGLFLVQWYSFLDGDETDQQLVRIEDMLDWKFYADEQQWHTAWDNSPRPKVSAR